MLAAASADPAPQPTAADGKPLPPLRWPTPPYIGYGGADAAGQPQASEVEGVNGQTRPCLLIALEPERRVAHIQVPPSRTVMPLRFDMFRRLTLTEPLAPAFRQNDSNWGDIVSWSVWLLMAAEEKGITQANVDEKLKSEDPDVQRMLGVTEELGKMLGLDNKWGYNIIKSVGNYGEIFERNVGEGTKLGLTRGPNALWNKGGLIFSPPIR